jgi:hypothetical protein
VRSPEAAAGVSDRTPRPGKFPRTARRLYDRVFGVPPLVWPWHREWLDYRIVTRELRQHMRSPGKAILYVADWTTPFDRLLGPAAAPVRKVSISELGTPPKDGGFGVCFLCLAPEDLRRLGEIWANLDRILPRGAEILLYVRASYLEALATDLAGLLMEHVPKVAPSLTGRFSFAGTPWRVVGDQLQESASRLFYRHPVWALPLALGVLGISAAVTLLSNLAQRSRSARRSPPAVCSSFFGQWEHEPGASGLATKPPKP